VYNANTTSQKGSKIAESHDELTEEDKMLLDWKDVSANFANCFSRHGVPNASAPGLRCLPLDIQEFVNLLSIVERQALA
jgi:hypothetical protein